MQKIGTALHIAKSGRLIIKADHDVRAGQFIVDQTGHKIAKVAETIGPVKSPYLSAIPISDRVKRAVSKEVYISDRDVEKK